MKNTDNLRKKVDDAKTKFEKHKKIVNGKAEVLKEGKDVSIIAIEGLECEDVKIWNDKLEINKDIIYIVPINLENNEVDKGFDK